MPEQFAGTAQGILRAVLAVPVYGDDTGVRPSPGEEGGESQPQVSPFPRFSGSLRRRSAGLFDGPVPAAGREADLKIAPAAF